MPSPATTAAHSDSPLGEIFDEILERMQTGEPVDIDAYIAAQPDHADELRALLPTMAALAELGYSDVGPRAHDARSGRPAGNDAAGRGSPGTDRRLVAAETNDRRSPDSAGQQPRCLGDFRIIRELGRGGMGVVYEAEQISLGRPVALKVLPFAATLGEMQLKRFKNEARAAALLDHPNIVSVHSVGVERGVHYYAMQLIEGASLAQVICQIRNVESGMRSDEGAGSRNSALRTPHSALDQSQIPNSKFQIDTEVAVALTTEFSHHPNRYFRRVAELGIQAAEALHHAHEQGVLHRDIKPANLLLDARGKLFITDFGLARTNTDASMTATGDLVGTLRYMSPEQLRGKEAVVDHRTDVYSLGIALYELATGTPAFPGQDRGDLVRQISAEEPSPPRQLRPEIPADFETILLKAIEKDPADRYVSAEIMADDLRRFANHESIHARRPSLAARGMKWTRRHPAVWLSTVCVLLVALAASLFAYRVSSREQSKTIVALHQKDAALRQAEQNLDFALQAVDDLYLELGTRWIADETAPTRLQRMFLDRARRVYLTVTDHPGTTLQERARTATAYERVAQIEHYLQRPRQAAEAVDAAIVLGETLAREEPQNIERRADLLRRYRHRADLRLERGDLTGASNDYEAGLVHLAELTRRDPGSIDYMLERVQFDQGRATLLLRRGEYDTAELLLRRAADYMKTLPREQGVSVGYRITQINNRLLLAGVLRAKGDLTAATEEAAEALTTCQHLNRSDERQVVTLEAEAFQVLGELAETQGDLQEAADQYKEALEIAEGAEPVHGPLGPRRRRPVGVRPLLQLH